MYACLNAALPPEQADSMDRLETSGMPCALLIMGTICSCSSSMANAFKTYVALILWTSISDSL
ncbi:MAG: hypothetical protein QXZ17_14245 [Nitrososphaerota archaeon]